MSEPLWTDERIDRECDEAFCEVGDGFGAGLMRKMRDEYEAKLGELEAKRQELLDYIVTTEGLLP